MITCQYLCRVSKEVEESQLKTAAFLLTPVYMGTGGGDQPLVLSANPDMHQVAARRVVQLGVDLGIPHSSEYSPVNIFLDKLAVLTSDGRAKESLNLPRTGRSIFGNFSCCHGSIRYV